MKQFYFTLLFLVCLCLPGVAQVISDFESGTTDGWISEGDGDYRWEAGTGNPGGCLRVDDDATGNTNRSYAPLKFLGNWSGATVNDTLRADILLHPISTTYISSNFVFRISGPGGTATAILSPTPPFDTWTTYKVSLSQSDWQLNSGTWGGLMQNVTALIVTMEYISGDEYDLLDNVRLSFTPVLQPVVPVVCSGFEEGGFDGWSFQGTGSVSNQASGGSPGRYVRVANGSSTGYAFAPPKFLGIWTGLDNHAAEICFDLLVTTSGSLQDNDAFLRISGPGGVAKIAMAPVLQAAFGQWHAFAYPIEASYWTIESGTWSQILAQVAELRICLEFSSASETVGIDDFCISNLPPVADFTTDYTYTFVGNPVQFTDLSDRAPMAWLWNFGDTGSSDLQNTPHTYNQAGTYDISLTASNFFGDHTKTIADHITVAGIESCHKFADSFAVTTIHPAWNTYNGTWSISSGILRQTSNYYGTALNDGCYAITGSQLWDNYYISADIQSTDDDHIGMVFRFQDSQNMYMFLWQSQYPSRALYKWVNGVGTILASDAVGYSENTWYHIMAGGYDNNITVWVNGEEIFTTTDDDWPTGKAGLYCRGNQNTLYDNVVVECAIYDTVNLGIVTVTGGQEICHEATGVITTGGSGLTFLVQDGGRVNLVAGQKIVMLPLTRVMSGGYLHGWITTDDTYCNSLTEMTKVITGVPFSGKSGIAPENRNGDFKIYPSPTSGLFFIEFTGEEPQGATSFEIFNLYGAKVISSKATTGGLSRIDLSGHPSGMYLVRIVRGQKVQTSRILVQR